MKNILFVLLVCPMMAFAQKASDKSIPNLKCTTLLYAKMVIRYGEVTENSKRSNTRLEMDSPGELNFSKDNPAGKQSITYSDPSSDSNTGIMTAEKVQIGCGSNPILKGDEMIMCFKTGIATLTGHITLVENGREKQVGQMALLDLSKDKYEIVCIK